MSVNTCDHSSISEINVNHPVKEAHLEGRSSTQCIGCHALWALTLRAECLVVSIPEVLNAILVDVTLVLDSLIRSDEGGLKMFDGGNKPCAHETVLGS
jgi:hypothetical protein